MTQERKKLIIITGLSGSGKTSALHTFEDIGYYCIDNLPVELIPTFLNLIARTKAGIQSIAMICDIREKRFLKNFEETYENLKKKRNLGVCLLFLEASDDALVRRYSETRRRHPVEDEPTLSDMVEKERKLLAGIRGMADMIIDSSDLTVHQLKKQVIERFALGGEEKDKLNITITSFGFKNGTPSDADIVFDVRFLPNPFFIDSLKDKNGMDTDVSSFVHKTDEYRSVFPCFSDLLQKTIPLYQKEGKSYLNIAIGCTGGQHRSVVIVEDITKVLTREGCDVYINHRDVNLIG